MSLDCSPPANTNEDQESAAAEDDGSISYALHALSELHLAAGDSPAERPAEEAATIETSAAARLFPATETLATEPAAESTANPGDALQSALDWYKGWLTSI